MKFIVNTFERFVTMAAAIVVGTITLPIAHSQDIEGSASCPDLELEIKYISLSRSGAGKLSLVLEYKNSTNFAMKPFQGDYGIGTIIVDDQGDTWKLLGMGGSVYNGKIFMSGVTTKLTYQFAKASGGNEATKGSAQIKLNLQPREKGGAGGICQFTLKNLPIKS